MKSRCVSIKYNIGYTIIFAISGIAITLFLFLWALKPNENKDQNVVKLLEQQTLNESSTYYDTQFGNLNMRVEIPVHNKEVIKLLPRSEVIINGFIRFIQEYGCEVSQFYFDDKGCWVIYIKTISTEPNKRPTFICPSPFPPKPAELDTGKIKDKKTP